MRVTADFQGSESVPLLLPCMVLFGVVVEHCFGCW